MEKILGLISSFCFLVLGTFPLFAQSSPAPLGQLGLPLGTFSVIEGKGIQSGKLFGSNNFELHVINGKILNPYRQIAVSIQVSPTQNGIEPGKFYVLHGYEGGAWAGAPRLPRGELAGCQAGPGSFGFHTQFFVSSIEKVDGSLVAGARPLDPNSPLPYPKPELYSEPKPPVGILGLPLGTFAVIEGTEKPTGMRLGPDDFVIEAINGKKLGHPAGIETEWSSEFPEKRTLGKRFILHGFERGTWMGSPDLPASETGGKLTQAQLAFQFIPHFVVTSIEKVDDVAVPSAKPADP